MLDLADSGTVSAKELRAVMLACCDIDVRFIDGKKMIQAASTAGGKNAVINFEEFERIIHWVSSFTCRCHLQSFQKNESAL